MSTYNDMWILSLPSFKWFKVGYPTQAPWQIAGGRTSHTCQIIGNRQMAIIGGGRSAEAHDQCTNTSLFVFDMSTLSWRNGFDSTQETYALPALITDVIGGHGGGGANLTLNRPTLWNDAYTTEIFTPNDSITEKSNTVTSTVASNTPNTMTGTHAPTPTGVIVGGVVGGIFALIVLGTIGVVWYRRRGQQVVEASTLTNFEEPEIQELSPDRGVHELQGPTPYLHELEGGNKKGLTTTTARGKYTPEGHELYRQENMDVYKLTGGLPQPPRSREDSSLLTK